MAFVKKMSPVMKYFSDRGMLLVNHFANDCGRVSFFMAVLLRILKRTLKFDFDSIRILEFALRDLNSGFEHITSIRADDKFAQLKAQSLNKNIFAAIFSIFNLTFCHCLHYNKFDKYYKDFRMEKLLDQKFWRHYLNI